MADPTWTLTEAARSCGVPRSALQRKLADGAFPNAVKGKNGAWQIPIADLVEAGFDPGGAEQVARPGSGGSAQTEAVSPGPAPGPHAGVPSENPNPEQADSTSPSAFPRRTKDDNAAGGARSPEQTGTKRELTTVTHELAQAQQELARAQQEIARLQQELSRAQQLNSALETRNTELETQAAFRIRRR